VRVVVINDQSVSIKEFPDTEPFVNSGSKLFVSGNGIYVVEDKQITLITIK
jgi:hypothetical protein